LLVELSCISMGIILRSELAIKFPKLTLGFIPVICRHCCDFQGLKSCSRKVAGQYKIICTLSKGDLEEEIIKYCVVNNIDIIIVKHEIHSELFGSTDVILLMP
jgi:hypothetical protein